MEALLAAVVKNQFNRRSQAFKTLFTRFPLSVGFGHFRTERYEPLAISLNDGCVAVSHGGNLGAGKPGDKPKSRLTRSPARILPWLGFVALALCPWTWGQYSLDWWTADAGGGSGGDAVFTLDCTFGQPDGGVMSDGYFTLAGGYWVDTVQGTVPEGPCPPFIVAAVYPTGKYPWAVAVSDFNGDGRADLAVANYGGGASVLLGLGDGAYGAATNFVTGANPVAVAVADFNGDGRQDLVTANLTADNVSVFLGAGDGTFLVAANSLAGTSPSAVAVGDFDEDGRPDVAVANKLPAGTVTVLRGLGNGSFQLLNLLAAGNSPSAVATGDFNGDGHVDLAVANVGSGTLSVFHSNGTGLFQLVGTPAVGPRPESVAVGDFDNNGWADLVVANNTSVGTVTVLLNNGSGGFAPGDAFAAGPVPRYVGVGDFNSDGYADLAVANFTTPGVYPVTILPGVGDGTFQAPDSYVGGPCPYALAVGDLNGDSHPDVAVANYSAAVSGVSVLLGSAEGRLRAPVNYAAGPGPVSVVGGDFNGDGRADLAVVNTDAAHPSVSVLTNASSGTFPARDRYAVGADPRSVAVADVDADGHADLVVANYSTSVSVLRGNGNGAFQAAVNSAVGPAGASATDVAVADLDNDGKLDLAVVNFIANTVSVLPGIGGVNFPNWFAYAAGASPLAVAAADFNGDGFADLAVANCLVQGTVSVLTNTGNGSFPSRVPYSVGSFPRCVGVGDFNGDGFADLVTGNETTSDVSVLLGNGNGTFQAPTRYPAGLNPWSLVVGDLDSDGHADVAAANAPYAGGVSLLLGNGNGTLQTAISYAAGSQSRTVTAADFNGDGRPDLAVGNYGSGTVSVLIGNECGGIEVRPLLRAHMDGANVVLSWEADARGFRLITSTDLSDPSSWTSVPGQPTVVNDKWTVITPIQPGYHFYQLRKP